MSNELTLALKARGDANEKIAEILKRKYPPGCSLAWEYNGIPQQGVVVRNGYGDRIKVRNFHSGKEYWIYAYRIV